MIQFAVLCAQIRCHIQAFKIFLACNCEVSSVQYNICISMIFHRRATDASIALGFRLPLQLDDVLITLAYTQLCLLQAMHTLGLWCPRSLEAGQYIREMLRLLILYLCGCGMRSMRLNVRVNEKISPDNNTPLDPKPKNTKSNET